VTTPAGVSGGQVFRSVRAGEGHTCGITSTGAALCWGSNGNGQLGSGTATKVVATPLAVAGGHTFTELDTGRYHTCGVTTLGEVRCWGYNGTGQLGNGTFSTSQTPTLSLFDLTPES
jgi:alpha-tubulin suppressor-like RCC1 family protein